MYQWICVNTHPNITQISVSLDLREYTYNHHTNRGVSTFVWSWGSIFYVYMIHILYIMYRIQRNEPILAQKWGDSHLCTSRGLNLTYTISPIPVWDWSWWGPVANRLQLVCGPTWTGLVWSQSSWPKSGKQKDQLQSGCLQIGVKDQTRPDFKTLNTQVVVVVQLMTQHVWVCT